MLRLESSSCAGRTVRESTCVKSNGCDGAKGIGPKGSVTYSMLIYVLRQMCMLARWLTIKSHIVDLFLFWVCFILINTHSNYALTHKNPSSLHWQGYTC
jgi:hypothetical protein